MQPLFIFISDHHRHSVLHNVFFREKSGLKLHSLHWNQGSWVLCGIIIDVWWSRQSSFYIFRNVLRVVLIVRWYISHYGVHLTAQIKLLSIQTPLSFPTHHQKHPLTPLTFITRHLWDLLVFTLPVAWSFSWEKIVFKVYFND